MAAYLPEIQGGRETGVYWKFRLGFEPEKWGVSNSADIVPLSESDMNE